MMTKQKQFIVSAQSSLSNFTQKYLHKCKDTYFILQNMYLCIYDNSFGAKTLGDDCALSALGPIIDFEKKILKMRHMIE